MKYSESEVRRIVTLYQSGLGVRSISHQVEMSEAHIEQILEGKQRIEVTGGRILNGRRICRSEAAKRGWKRKRELEKS